jgi:hypothetical protein
MRIGEQLTEFYRAEHPEVPGTPESDSALREAIESIRAIYSTSFFTSMKVDWRTYPDNIGHWIFPGCYRCHDGKHINQRGEPISHDCHVCHTFLNPVDKERGDEFLEEGEFIHPMKLEGSHAELRCDLCHTGGISPQPTCAGCHTEQQAFREGTLTAFDSFDISPEPMAGDLECEDCHDLSESTTVEAIDTMCMDCHEDEEDKYRGMLAGWKKAAGRLIDDATATADDEGLRLLEALRRAGPLHNIDATRVITGKLSLGQGAAVADEPASEAPAPPES